MKEVNKQVDKQKEVKKWASEWMNGSATLSRHSIQVIPFSSHAEIQPKVNYC